MIKHKDRLLFKFALLFIVFTAVAMFLSGITTFIYQTNSYKKSTLENLRNVADYLELLIQESGDDFISYQKYYMEHFAEAKVPFDFTEYNTAHRKCEQILADSGIKLKEGEIFNFENFPEEVKMAYFTYVHEYWILTFENARKAFNLPYTYYLVPKEKIFNMVYMIDGERTPKNIFGEKSLRGDYLYLGDEYHDSYESTPVQWDTWISGERQEKFQIWNNKWGHTYAYYVPVFVKGQKLGLIGAEIQVEAVNKEILKNTLSQISCVGAVLVFCITLMLLYIRKQYILKLVRLEANLRDYSNQKNPEIALKIQEEITGNDEISSLSRQFAFLILKIEDYIKSLFDTSQKLKDTQARADKMKVIASRDSLTGVRNKNAYDNEIKRLEFQISQGQAEFGIAMIDLNFLKHINDTYGHDQGNIAIKRLSSLVCQIFNHSPVFRIGGDEFIVILEHCDYKEIETLCMNFNIQLEIFSKNIDLKPWEQISAALGYALYDKKTDSCVLDVFHRADQAMYERKKQMKALRKD